VNDDADGDFLALAFSIALMLGGGYVIMHAADILQWLVAPV
jgi:hypothetical protein